MKKYAFAGASGRGYDSYALPMYQRYAHTAQLVGIFDTNRGRSEYVSKQCGGIPVYDDFDKMIESSKPDTVIITTVDAYHSQYLIRSMELGCDVIVEKPLTTDAAQCKAIMEAEKKYGKKVTVIFNMRYTPFCAKIKELIMGGAIGDVYSVHMEWLLDRLMSLAAHGTSYYRRWNGRMDKSGGLLLHKSSHHFDAANWIIDATPKKVSAFGKLNLYGKNNPYRGENCRNCAHTKECPFYYQLNDFEKEFYANQEKYDGYYKDGCVFDEDIDIYDTMSLNVQYDTGIMMSYTLNATSPYEGYRISINGSKGRLEAYSPFYGFRGNAAALRDIQVFDLSGNQTIYKVAELKGSHGGSDDLLLEDLFGEGVKREDLLGRRASTKAGVDAVMIGAAANVAIKEGIVADIDELLK